ncbi:MAG: flagellar basal body-associated protein FliL [Candidatus Zixiibacteriota bacterium]
MAKDEDKTVVESSADGDSDGSDKSAGKTKKPMLLFGGIGVAVIAIGVALALFIVKPMMSGDEVSEEDGTEQIESNDDGGHDKKAKGDQKKKSKPKKKHKKKEKSHGDSEEGGSEVYTIKDIVINPAGTGGTRFLSVSFAFDLESPDMAAEMESREPIIRDALITILSSKTVAQLTDTKQKEIIRYQIKKRIEKLLDTDELAGVYYTDFVLQ